MPAAMLPAQPTSIPTRLLHSTAQHSTAQHSTAQHVVPQNSRIIKLHMTNSSSASHHMDPSLPPVSAAAAAAPHLSTALAANGHRAPIVSALTCAAML